LFPYDVEQSTNYYSEKDLSPDPKIAEAPSIDPTVEKAQHDPHYP